jgi:hypothetical protein
MAEIKQPIYVLDEAFYSVALEERGSKCPEQNVAISVSSDARKY